MSAALEHFRAACRDAQPLTAVVLGSGLGEVAARVQVRVTLPFREVPGLAPSSIPGHRGQFSLGTWVGQTVIVQEGRIHFYEGHPWERVVLPSHFLADLGIKQVIHTNAAGGIASALGPGSLMALREHMDATWPWWWRRLAQPSPYSPRLLSLLQEASRSSGVPLASGVYAALTGPSYETPAEIRALRSWGADAVGMSTAREACAAVERGLECAGIACITNKAAGLSSGSLSHEEVVQEARSLAGKVGRLLEEFLGILLRLRL